MIITFVGHSFVRFKNQVKEIVKGKIKNTIMNSGFVTCYLGGYGEFDEICACVCRELKQSGVRIEVVYVTPYISLAQQAKIKENEKCGLYDTSIYPPIEKTPLRFAISKRNEWMITNADLIIAYVNHSSGVAYKSFRFAKCKGKDIINICDFL